MLLDEDLLRLIRKKMLLHFSDKSVWGTKRLLGNELFEITQDVSFSILAGDETADGILLDMIYSNLRERLLERTSWGKKQLGVLLDEILQEITFQYLGKDRQ